MASRMIRGQSVARKTQIASSFSRLRLCSMSNVQEYPVAKQHEWPCMPNQIKDIDRCFQRVGHEHSDFLDDMRLRIERGETEGQYQGEEDTVVKEMLHGWGSFFVLPRAWLQVERR